jgi:hypothetical protein
MPAISLQVECGIVEKYWCAGIRSHLNGVLTFLMNKSSLTILILLTLPALTHAQNDPLSLAYLPSIDANAADYPSNIWITDTMQKVRQDSGSPGMSHWGTFYGTQNEFVDFQVHVHAPKDGIANLRVATSDFVNQRTGTRISASSTNIIVYREAYINVTGHLTSVANTFYNSFGRYPDILIPSVDPYFHQTTNAWPFTVAANQNQSAWIDVLIPPNASSGYYLGSIAVHDGRTTLATLPVILAVWQWPGKGYMPSTASLSSDLSDAGSQAMCIQSYGSYTACGSYPGSRGNYDTAVAVTNADAGAMFLDHRWSFYDHPYASDNFSKLDTWYGPYLSGNGTGHVATLLSGAKVTGITTVGNQPSDFQSWVTKFQTRRWSSLLYSYTADEPGSRDQWTQVNAWGRAAHATTPALSTLVTTDLAKATSNNALNNIDILVVEDVPMEPFGGSLQRNSYNAWLSGTSGPTRRLWRYTSCDGGGSCSNGAPGDKTRSYPNLDVDGKPAANRVGEWLTFLHNQSGELYYDAVLCWGQPRYCNGASDPWEGVYASGGWGDGTLVYPGTTAHLGAGVTTPIWLPSVRLKHMRDGMQDYEYMHVLTNAGRREIVEQSIGNWIENSYTFETSGTGLQSARLAFGRALHQLTYPDVSASSRSLNGTPH